MRTLQDTQGRDFRDWVVSLVINIFEFFLEIYLPWWTIYQLVKKLEKTLGIFTISCYPGLDPAQPNYQNFDDQVRLDQGDAVFVDAIHTDGSDYDTISGLFQNV